MQLKQSKSSQFGKDLELIIEGLQQNQIKIVRQALTNQNDRQKLKTIKKVLQGPESELKNIFNRASASIIVKQYIFGNVESKPTLLNIFKVLHVPPSILLAFTSQINTFTDVKMTVQIIEILSVSGQLSAEGKQKLKIQGLIEKIYDICLKEFQKGKGYIQRNQFRTKWLDTFVQILRCINYTLKFIGQERQRYKQRDHRSYQLAQKCAIYSHILNKQVITQLYILLVYLNNNLQSPSSTLQQIHYLHACTVVKGQIVLKSLLKIANQTKDTELKAQLTPILLKSFQWFIQKQKIQNRVAQFDEQLKKNSFDYAISLFDVGRSIYSYLEEIIDIIITKGGSWSLEGNFTRKFFITKIALKHAPTKAIFQLWPRCLEDCFMQSGNMTMAYVTDCAEALLIKLYQQLNRNYKQWIEIWIQSYKKCLLSGNRSYIRGITQFINPILLKIDSSNSLLLRQILKMPQEDLVTQLGVISLIKCYKQVGKIESTYNVYLQQQEKKKQQKNKKQKKLRQQAKTEKQSQKNIQTQTLPIQNKQNLQLGSIKQKDFQKLAFIHLDDPSFQFGSQFLLDLLLSNDSMTAIQTLDFFITSKKPSNLIIPQQMQLIILFYKNCLKTSKPQFRKGYLNLTRRMLQRFRKNYQKDLTIQKQKVKNQRKKQQQRVNTPYFQNFVKFLNQLIQLCFANIYPDSIFQITNPALQILHLIVNIFGLKGHQIRKGTYIEPSNVLVQRTNFFNIYNFQNLVICLQSSYESIRSIAYQIIKNFDRFDQQSIQVLKNLFNQAIQNTNKLSIKSYQFACRLLTYVSSIEKDNKTIIQFQNQKCKMKRLNLCYFLLQLLKKRYEIFKNQFVDQGQIYYKNLIHGILTCYSYILDEISSINQLQTYQLQQLKVFLSQFFQQMIKILNFSVDICSANVSTVVLDTIANASQTDKKMTVDCRGHFLTQKKNAGNSIGNYLDSTALISSMENEEQGIQNTLVVSFYLLTREAGLVFQSIGGIMGNELISKHVPKKQLIQLVNTYFYALINLKHMGSVDRISIGLSKMAKVIFDQQDKELVKVPEQLLGKLLQLLSDGKFTNILRRSAGVPYAFTCLLKSQAIKRKLLIQKTISSLIKLTQFSNQTSIQLRIHALNILKKLFQDSDLKQDLDAFVSEAFISSIKGFTSQQWGVRNSSLMLFSVLANRTVGIKPTFNLIEFFHKCPELLQFISKQLSQRKAPTMYPPLYPIVLLLSRLLPFDLRQKARISVKGNTNKQMRKQQLLTLLPLVRQAGDNHNYMGRVMTAKAILPFMYLSNIIPHCLSLLQQYITNAKAKKINNNSEHYRLTECYQLLRSYQQITNNSQSPNSVISIPNQLRTQIYNILVENVKLISWSQSNDISPTVQEIYINVYNFFISNYFDVQALKQTQNSLQLSIFYSLISSSCENLFQEYISIKNYGDLGHSLMYKSCIELLSVCYRNQLLLDKQKKQDQQQNIGVVFVKYLNSQKLSNLQNQLQVDYQILCLVLQKIVELIIVNKTHRVYEKLELQQQLNLWINQINFKNIQDDNTMIKILSFLQTNPKRYKQQKLLQFIKILQEIQRKSQNKYMKVAIFCYLLQVLQQKQTGNKEQDLKQERLQIYSQSQKMLQSLLDSYSNPDQLQDLRECCILYLEKAQTLKSNLLIVYIRLLQDQQYQIRRRAAYHISRLLKIKPCNEFVVLKQILYRYLAGKSFINTLRTGINKQLQQVENQKMSTNQQSKFIIEVLQKNSDYNIRAKNHAQQRIFSYDKPNKYRTDINTLYQIVTLVEIEVLKQSQKIYSQNMRKNNEDYIKIVNETIKSYGQKIMQRDQYQFETILRTLFLCRQTKLQNLQKVAKMQPILYSVYKKLYL